MGQYFRPLLSKNGKITVFNRNVNKEYTLAKLTEHSWWLNPMVNYVAKQLYCERGRLAWVGDYVEEKELQALNIPRNMKQIWDSKGVGITIDKNQDNFTFTLDNKFLINHTKKLYVDLKDYKKLSDSKYTYCGKGWILHPLSLLTAIGNGRGGGDYSGLNYPCVDLVGTWAWDLISIEDTCPKDYTKLDLCFMELSSENNKKVKHLSRFVKEGE